MLPDLSTSACAWCWSADGSNRRFPETLRRTLPRFPASWPWRGRGSGEPSFSVLAGKCKVGFKNFRFCLKKKNAAARFTASAAYGGLSTFWRWTCCEGGRERKKRGEERWEYDGKREGEMRKRDGRKWGGLLCFVEMKKGSIYVSVCFRMRKIAREQKRARGSDGERKK